jgi:CHAT domain-containing protein/tetratricopeptide (TPR) repeat protein
MRAVQFRTIIGAFALAILIGGPPTPIRALNAESEIAASQPSPRPELSPEDQARASELQKQIQGLRGQAKYAEAIPLAEELLALRRRAQGDLCDETGDALRLASLLRRIAPLPPQAQEELAEADRADAEGKKLYEQHQFEQGVELIQRQISLRRAHLGDDPAVADSLNNLGAHLQERRDFRKAEQCYREALEIRARFLGRNHPKVAHSLQNLAGIRRELGDLDAAATFLREALTIWQELFGENHVEVARTMNNLAIILDNQGEFSESERLLRKAMQIRRNLLGQHDEVADSLANLGVFLMARKQYPEAERFMREALALDRRLHGDRGLEAGFGLMGLAQLSERAGDLAVAETLCREGLSICRERLDSNDPQLALILHNLTAILVARGDYEAAESLAREALEIRRHMLGDEHPGVADSLNALALILCRQDRVAQAETLFRDALRIRRERFGQHRLVTESLINLAFVLKRKADYSKAESLLREAVSMHEYLESQGDELAIMAQLNLALLLIARRSEGDAREADQIYAACLSICRKNDSPQLMHVCTSYGNCLSQVLERPEDAVPLYQEAIVQLERSRLAAGPDAVARARYFTVLSEWDAFGGMVRAQTARAAAASTRADLASATEAALEYLERGRGRALLDLLSRTEQDFSSVLALRAGDQKGRATNSALAALDNRRESARAAALSSERGLRNIKRTPALDDAQRNNRARELDRNLGDAMRSESAVIDELLELARRELAPSGVKPLGALQIVRQLREGELLLAFDSSRIDTLVIVVRPIPAGISETPEAPANCISALRLTWPHGEPVDAASLQSTISQVVRGVSRERDREFLDEARESAHSLAELRSTLLPGELGAELARASRVFVIPDGPLHRLPIDVLMAREVRQDDVGPAFLYGPSATVLMRMRERAAAHRKDGTLARNRPSKPPLIAVGDPLFTPRPSPEGAPASAPASEVAVASANEPETALMRERTRDAFGDLRPLPATRREVEAIAKLVDQVSKRSADDADSAGLKSEIPKSEIGDQSAGRNPQPLTPDVRAGRSAILLGKDATVTNLFSAVDRPRFLHLATHALVDGGPRVYDSALALAAPETLTADDDGFLRLGDLLYKWSGKLEGTELVTLSACRTAQGRLEAGDGFVALTWGFLFAGADSVIASLWKVDDTATALLMTRFYENLLGTGHVMTDPQIAQISQNSSQADPLRPSAKSADSGSGLRTQDSGLKPQPKAEALRDAKRWLKSLSRADAERACRSLGVEKSDMPRGGPPLGRGEAVTSESSDDRPYADPYYWAAFILIGDGD